MTRLVAKEQFSVCAAVFLKQRRSNHPAQLGHWSQSPQWWNITVACLVTVKKKLLQLEIHAEAMGVEEGKMGSMSCTRSSRHAVSWPGFHSPAHKSREWFRNFWIVIEASLEETITILCCFKPNNRLQCGVFLQTAWTAYLLIWCTAFVNAQADGKTPSDSGHYASQRKALDNRFPPHIDVPNTWRFFLVAQKREDISPSGCTLQSQVLARAMLYHSHFQWSTFAF